MFETSNVAAEAGQGVQPFNPLQTIQQIAATQNLMNQNKLFQAQQAAGQARQGAINPLTGAYDVNAANMALAIRPDAALAVPEALANNQQYATGAQALGAARMTAARGVLGPLMTAPNVQPTDFVRSVGLMTNAGAIDHDTAAGIVGNMPSDPAMLRGYIANAFGFPNLGAQGTLDATAPAPAVVHTGNAVKQIAPPPRIGPDTLNGAPGPGGVSTVGPPGVGPTVEGSTPTTLSPGDLASPVSTVDASGAAHMGVLGNYVNPDGSWQGGVAHPLTALGPLSQSANAALGSNYGGQIANFEQTAAASATQRQTIENLRQEAAGFSSGPHADAWKQLGELMSEYHITPPANFGSSDQTAASEAFTKSMTMLMGAQQQALHMDQTDASRQTAQAAVPGIATTPAGRQQVLAILEGNADMINAAGKAWAAQKAKGGAASWGQFQMEFPNRVPPSIFQSQYMTPAQVGAMQKGWSQDRIAHWNAVKAAAAKNGWLPNGQ